MNEMERRRLRALVGKVIRSRFDDDGWSRVDRAFTLVERSLRTGTEDWIIGRNDLLSEFAAEKRAPLSGLRDSLGDRSDKPAPQPTREHGVRLLHQIGPVPRQERRVDDSA